MPRLFLNSIPKAGAHLAERALAELGCARGQGPLGSATIIGRSQWSKSLVRGPWLTSDLVLVGIELATPVKASWLGRRLDRVPAGRYLRGHVQYSGYFEALLRERDFRLLHVVRDPRDVVVSHAHYMLARPRHPFHRFYRALDDWENRLAFSITGGHVPGVGYLASIGERCRLMEGWLAYPQSLTIRFEDLVGSGGGGSRERQIRELERLCAVLEVEARDLDAAADSIFGDSSTFRRGHIGAWQESFDDRHRALFDQVCGDMARGWGYDACASEAPDEVR